MGTRGLLGFVIDGDVRATYNHYDSYPSGLGVEVGKFASTLHGVRLTEYADKARKVALIDEQVKPTKAEQEKYAAWTDSGVSEGNDWYAILRNAQGNLGAYLDMGIMPDNLEFAHDSLFCEWGYLINFDSGMLEVYRGFQKDPAAVKGRFANGESDSDYTSITLLGTIPFTLADSDTFWQRLEAAVYAEDEKGEVAITEAFAHELTT